MVLLANSTNVANREPPGYMYQDWPVLRFQIHVPILGGLSLVYFHLVSYENVCIRVYLFPWSEAVYRKENPLKTETNFFLLFPLVFSILLPKDLSSPSTTFLLLHIKLNGSENTGSYMYLLNTFSRPILQHYYLARMWFWPVQTN